MSLYFLYGNSGNGKSEYIFQKTADMAEQAPYQRYFVVVPEQFTMRAQKSLVAHTKNHVILNVDVVSFDRLAYRVFDELGIHHTVMEETGKSLVLRRIVEEKERYLTILKGNLTKMGYIGELKSMISELMQYGISPDDLESFLGELKEDSALRLKLSDILHIYRSFYEYLQDGYVTAEKVLEVLCGAAADSALLKDAVLVFDGFTGFTPVQVKLLRELMLYVRDIYVTVTLDTREILQGQNRRIQMQDLFYMSHKMVNALTEAAEETGFEIADPLRIDACARSRFGENPVLAHLEQNLFRAGSRAYEDECGSRLNFYSISSPKEELHFAAASIQTLVREKGYCYRDFAIVSGNIEGYEKYADAVFSMYGIPYFTDVKQTILYHPLIELIRAAMEMAEKDLSYESVFRYLRTGLCGFLPEEADLLENYCMEKGIRGLQKWEKPFRKPFARHGRICPEEEKRQDELSSLNQLRERLCAQIGDFITVFQRKDASVRERTGALYQLLYSLNTEDRIREKQEKFELDGEERLSSAYRQIYKIVIDLFDKLTDLLGDEVLSISDYADVLEAGLSSARVGSIPQGNDCLILGDIERTRLDGVRVLFFLGVNDGVIPKKSQRGSILSQYDREVMEEHELELAPGEREQVFLQRFYLYLNLTKPSDALYLTWSRLDGEGKAVRPSYLIGTMQKLFPKLVVHEMEAGDFQSAVTPKSAVETYVTGLMKTVDFMPENEYLRRPVCGEIRERDDMPDKTDTADPQNQQKITDQTEKFREWKALHRWFMKQPEWAPLIRTFFDAHFRHSQGEYLEAKLAQLLYGAVLVNSVTRLELFAKCAYAHFLEYGLKLADRKECTFESLDMGTMFHSVLRKYCVSLEKSYSWDSVTDQQQEELLRQAMEEAVLEMPNESLLESSRSAYVIERIYRIMRRSISVMTEQIRRGDFRPGGYEVEFSQVSKLSPETLMRTVGTVDRLDIYENEDKIYIKVVDYKSGGAKFQLLSLYYGMQLQLVVYLNAAMELLAKQHPEKEIVPAGILYFHLDDPMTEGEERSDEEIFQEILSDMRPNGLVNLEQEAWLHMDRDLLTNRKSAIVPITLKKDLTISKTGTSAVSTDDFNQLRQYVGEVIDSSAKKILGGDIRVNPCRLGDHTGCDYCSFCGVCGFDRRISGYAFEDETYMKDEEIWEKIRGLTPEK
ncbi:MAG: PD-(D/E)XK nuclease family protein [Clostridiales bacterium]|nr:PD-(D/E)XK nuclease family protein [Clostridiales bacterium]